jgi:alpha-L-fucosidase
VTWRPARSGRSLDKQSIIVALVGALTGCPLSDNYLIDPAMGSGGTTDLLGSGGAGGTAVNDASTGGFSAGGATTDSSTNDMGPGPKPKEKDAATDAPAGPTTVELAFNKSATASSEQTSKGNLAPLGNDGDPGTRWSAADAITPKWWRVDLGATHRISRVEIDWEFARPYGYLIEVSPNDTMYTTLVDRSANGDPTQSQAADVNAMGRYVRITVTSVTAIPISWASFWEVRVYGM